MRTEVIVAGAGPTGLMLAHELTLAGVPTVVLERQTARGAQSRAGQLQPRTAEVLDLRGLLAPLLADAPSGDAAGGAADGAPQGASRGASSGHFAALPVELDCRPWQTRYPGPVTLPQARLEAFLEERLVRRGVPVLRGHEVTEVEQDADGVTVGGIRAGYLVACDGGHSTIRKLLGVPFPGRASTMSSVVADITLASRSDAVPAERGHFSGHTGSGGGFFSVLAPLDGAVYRLIFGKLSGEGPGRDVPVAAEEVDEALRAVYGPGTRLGELRAASRFGDAVRQVERYREGRVFFAGDAAHIHMPIGGQGVNLGTQDAVNLGWKLAATVRGWAPEGLLDTYHAERHPIGARVLRHTRAQAVLLNAGRDEEVAALRDIVTDLVRLPEGNRFISGLMSGLDIQYPGLGPRMIDVDLTTEDGPTRVSALTHSGRGLLLSFDGKDRRIDGWADRVDHVAATTDEDIDAVLIRPDGYIAWSATDTTPLETALARWFGPASRPGGAA
ncbi:FAD-dependent monooxygenase [Streptomyces sp. G-G2]|uniref:FAD-dependent monooxygenase n=1 Tax=Streptomyces sp. G-G2 TaxID=3046201 RepID=UPI0024BB6451|nr:FAD-dependent monooxygenase [Streptomyces sp. G-G2]MDJ0382032.1 FAD-dependent monooxygenase [Streptomyces sp. G-G2]